MPTVLEKKYQSFSEFYPAYLNEHTTSACREMHFAGSTLALACLLALLITQNIWWLPAAALCGYGFAWIGHYVFEKNRPATFSHPFYSFMGDWVMYWQMLTGQTSF